MTKEQLENSIDVFVKRARRPEEIKMASAAYPEMEIGSAYVKWKTLQGGTPEMLITGRDDVTTRLMETQIQALKERPCTKTGCTGTQVLEPICSGCVEGQAGYKTKWTCKTCLHRDLSKEDILTWLKNLSSSSQE